MSTMRWKLQLAIVLVTAISCTSFKNANTARSQRSSLTIVKLQNDCDKCRPHHLKQPPPTNLLRLQSTSSSTLNFSAIYQSTETWKFLSWAGFAGICLGMRSFFPLFVQTFILSCLGTSVIKSFESIQRAFNNRFKIKVNIPRKVFAAVYLVLLFFCMSRLILGAFPGAFKEFTYFVNLIKSDEPFTTMGGVLSGILGVDLTSKLESLLLPMVSNEIRGIDRMPSAMKIGKILQHFSSSKIQDLLAVSSRFISLGSSAVYNCLLSMVFSTMVIWDFPALADGVSKLERSRLGFAYREIAPKVSSFATLVGQNLETTALIALCNTILTTLGLFFLKLPSLGFFSLLTFVCSFIPVAGIFIATFPPFIVALTEFGGSKCLELVAMVVGVHAVESYFLYPQIYAYRLKLHPLLIVVTLAIAEHFAGVKGLFFGIPVLLYAINQLMPNELRPGSTGKAWKMVGEEVVGKLMKK